MFIILALLPIAVAHLRSKAGADIDTQPSGDASTYTTDLMADLDGAVSCGLHMAMTCFECPQGHADVKSFCNGDCTPMGDAWGPETSGGICVPKTSKASFVEGSAKFHDFMEYCSGPNHVHSTALISRLEKRGFGTNAYSLGYEDMYVSATPSPTPTFFNPLLGFDPTLGTGTTPSPTPFSSCILPSSNTGAVPTDGSAKLNADGITPHLDCYAAFINGLNSGNCCQFSTDASGGKVHDGPYACHCPVVWSYGQVSYPDSVNCQVPVSLRSDNIPDITQVDPFMVPVGARCAPAVDDMQLAAATTTLTNASSQVLLATPAPTPSSLLERGEAVHRPSVITANLSSNLGTLLESRRDPSRWTSRLDFGSERKELTKLPLQQKVVFLKTFKAGSRTIESILLRYGSTHGLSFAYPLDGKSFLGWPYQFSENFYQSFAPDGHVDILAEHAADSPEMRRVFPQAAYKYISIVRHPWEHLKSVWHWYGVDRFEQWKLGRRPTDSLKPFFEDFARTEPAYMQHPEMYVVGDHKTCVPPGMSIVRGLQAFSLGIRPAFAPGDTDFAGGSEAELEQQVRELDGRYDLVMVLEHLPESLVLLKRMMGWELADVLYLKHGMSSYAEKGAEYDRALEATYKNISAVDYVLYDHFNRSLWTAIEKEVDFFSEVEELQRVQAKVKDFCGPDGPYDYTLTKDSKLNWKTLTMTGLKFSNDVRVDFTLCEEMARISLPDLKAKEMEKCEGCKPKKVPAVMAECFSLTLGRYGYC